MWMTGRRGGHDKVLQQRWFSIANLICLPARYLCKAITVLGASTTNIELSNTLNKYMCDPWRPAYHVRPIYCTITFSYLISAVVLWVIMLVGLIAPPPWLCPHSLCCRGGGEGEEAGTDTNIGEQFFYHVAKRFIALVFKHHNCSVWALQGR